jgi:L-lactate permease
MEIKLISWLLAASPIIIFLTLILGMKWRGSYSGILTWVFTVLIASIFFGADLNLLGYATLKAFFVALDILLIILSALFLHRITEKAGTIQKIGLALS